MQRRLIISLVFAILVAIFALQNSAEVVIRLFFWSVDTSLALVVILTFSAGALMGLLFSIPARRRRKNAEHLLTTDPGSTNIHEVPLEVNSPEDLRNGDPEFEDVIN